MRNTDPRVDAYIAKAADFAKPVLRHRRTLVHEGRPEAEETLKWSAPAFLHGGRILCGMAAFKAHCTFGFWHKGMEAVLGGDGAKAGEAPRDRARVARGGEVPELEIRKVLSRRAARQRGGLMVAPSSAAIRSRTVRSSPEIRLP